jgi:predicted TIM-barrel fold metal-dependent hydrolase
VWAWPLTAGGQSSTPLSPVLSFPDLKIVLNHAGVPLGINAYRGKRDEVFAAWSSSLKALAEHQNVYVKIGGLGQRYTGLNFNERAEPPSSAVVAENCRPYVETCIEAFGASRSMFESNFPVDKPSYSYQVFWNACKLMTKGPAVRRRPISSGNGHEVLSSQRGWLKAVACHSMSRA